MKEEKSVIKNSLWLTRKKRGLSQKQLAWVLGHKNSSLLCRWENGDSLPDLKGALKLSIALSLPFEFLFRELYVALKAQMEPRRDEMSQKIAKENQEMLNR